MASIRILKRLYPSLSKYHLLQLELAIKNAERKLFFYPTDQILEIHTEKTRLELLEKGSHLIKHLVDLVQMKNRKTVCFQLPLF